MTELLKLPEFLERHSKSSSGIMLIICCIVLGIGFLLIYDSTTEIIIKDKALFLIGALIVVVSLFMLFLLYSMLYKDEKRLQFRRLRLITTQIIVSDLDLQIKLIEYNEKAIAYNEKNESPEMAILNLNDLTDMMIATFPE